MTVAVVGGPTDPPRVAFATGRTIGSAVVRNRVRRRLRAAVREHRALLRPGHGYLIRAAAPTADATYLELSGALCHALRAHLDEAAR